jgi:hypothetical protein
VGGSLVGTEFSSNGRPINKAHHCLCLRVTSQNQVQIILGKGLQDARFPGTLIMATTWQALQGKAWRYKRRCWNLQAIGRGIFLAKSSTDTSIGSDLLRGLRVMHRTARYPNEKKDLYEHEMTFHFLSHSQKSIWF